MSSTAPIPRWTSTSEQNFYAMPLIMPTSLMRSPPIYTLPKLSSYGDKQQAYRHLGLYLDACLAKCKLSCHTYKQRVRHGSVPFSCANCRVALYCSRKHKKLTWKYARICHKVLCPAKKKHKKHKVLTNEDRCECERVFDAFFESICPLAKACIP